MTNEELLNNLRENTHKILSMLKNDEVSIPGLLIEETCKDFVALDISLLGGGQLPGAWGSSKLSKSNLS